MRIVFCDDDSQIVELLKKYVSEFFSKAGLEQPEYASFLCGDDLLCCEKKVDIAFLDVELPGRNGIYVGEQLMKYNPRVKVFIVTSYQDYLDEAMRVRVFRFLSKPINKNRLFCNLKDALYQYSIETVQIPIETRNGVVICTVDDIVCFEGTSRETIIYTIDGEICSTEGIKYWQSQLEDLVSLYSSYRNYIVNMKYVVSFDRQLIKLKYQGNEISAYLARRKYVDFKRKYLLFLESIR